MTTDAVVVDTHALLWWLEGAGRLSRRAATMVASASVIGISSISFWEVAMLASKSRVDLDRPIGEWVRDVLAAERVHEHVVDARVAVAAAGLVDFHGDPADRIIVATALLHGVPLVTKDRLIRDWAKRSGELQCVW